MKKEFRVLKSEEFTRIIKTGKFYATRGLVLYATKKDDNYPHSRIGISVKKKTGNAVVRNKCKRQVRMMCQDIFNFDENFDAIILVKEAFIENSYEINRNNLEKLYKKVKID